MSIPMKIQEIAPTNALHPVDLIPELHAPPEPSYHFIDLPLTTLHYVKCGEGPPLIIVPATISEIDNWLPLIQFMGQKFTAHFFELPGHGKSTPFDRSFTSDQVAQTVGHLADALGFETFSLMGFSFGGLLTMKSVFHLADRLDQVILLSPAATHRALTFNKFRRFFLFKLSAFLTNPTVCKCFVNLIHNKFFGYYIAVALRYIGQVEESVPIEDRLKEIKGTTIQVLVHQITEILTFEHPLPDKKFSIPCSFAMSVLDPLLDYHTTVETVDKYFENMTVEKFYFPYHQPKVLPTFDELNRDFSPFLNMIQ